MSEVMKHKLSEGYTTVLFRDGDYYYSYFLWFEDNIVRSLNSYCSVCLSTAQKRFRIMKYVFILFTVGLLCQKSYYLITVKCDLQKIHAFLCPLYPK